MLNDLDKALKALLNRELADLPADNVRFERPDKEFQPALPALNLFLYDVRENRDLRENEWLALTDIAASMVALRRPPARVDCSYLITAWAGDPASEHRLLGRAMRALLRFRELPSELLPDALKIQGLPLPVSALQPTNLQTFSEFWQALDGKPRAALHYMVTIAIDPFDDATEAPLVLEAGAGIAQPPGEEPEP